MADTKKIELAKKIKALADRGVDSEKINAQERLKEFLAKYKLSLDDIEDEKAQLRPFAVKPEERKFFRQIVSSVLGNTFDCYVSNKKENVMFVKVTNAEFCEIEIKFRFHWENFWKDVQVFYKAYINKNNLTIKNSYVHRTPTPTEQQEINRMWQMAEYIPNRVAPTGGDTILKRLDSA